MRQTLEMAFEALVLNNAEWKSLADSGDAGFWLAEEQDFYKQAEQAITAIKEALAQPEQEPVAKYCCHLCFNKSGQLFLDRMIVCPECGNKRCPKATHHELLCTNSNESNQAGSVYTTPPQRTWVGLSTDEFKFIASKYLLSREAGLEYFQEEIEAKLKEKNT